MERKRFLVPVMLAFLVAVGLTFFSPLTSLADSTKTNKWWIVEPEDETPSPYYTSMKYSEIAPTLREFTKDSNRLQVEVIGQSAGGRNLLLATIAAPGEGGRFGHYQNLRRLMIRDPERAQQNIDKFEDFKVPVFINASIHGTEYPGTDAVMRLIETLVYDNSPEVQAILDNVILLINVCQNPDGRVLGERYNSANVDINRDFITQSQPETRATVSVMTKWNPMVFIDLHGFFPFMLIEPATPLHNPNYEYDLYIEWAIDQALAMEAEVVAQTDQPYAWIPYRDWPSGWEDWLPIYGSTFPLLHGAYGHTIETHRHDQNIENDDSPVDAHYAALWGMLKFVAENRKGMIRDQIEVFRRGYFDLPQMPIVGDPLDKTYWPDLQNYLSIQEFPEAYIIPADTPFQLTSHQAATLVDFLLFNDVQVEKAKKDFWHEGTLFPGGTYVVWMNQPKRGLANTILEDGMDLSFIEGLTFYSPPAAWSHPLLWGVHRVRAEETLDIATTPINSAKKPIGSVMAKNGNYFTFAPTSIAAFKATNALLKEGVSVFRATASFEDSGLSLDTGTFLVPKAYQKSMSKVIADYALDVSVVADLPEHNVPMYRQRIAVIGDGGITHCLNELGFDYDTVFLNDLNAGLIEQYDVFLNHYLKWDDLDATGQASMAEWFAAGGDYVGLGNGGAGSFGLDYGGRAIDFANMALIAGTTGVTYEAHKEGNGIVNIDYDLDDTVAAGFRADGHAFVYDPLWFTDLGDCGMQISASYGDEDLFVAGYWWDWENSPAKNMPAVIHCASGDDGIQDTVLIGIDATFRGHTRNTFRLVGNAIYSGIE